MNFKLGMGLSTIAIIALLASGCDKPAATTPAPAAPSVVAETATAPEVAPAAPVAITQDSPIWFEPEALSSCAKDQVAVIHWSAASFPGVTTVKITTPIKDGEEAVFAVTGNVNQKEAGPWVRGGTLFIMRNNADDSELARAEYPSLPCEE